MASNPCKFHGGEVVEVLLPLPFARGFDYLVPDGMALQAGSIVTVPFGKKTLAGVVWGEGGATDPAKLKTILECHNVPPLSEAMRGFLDWAAWYNLMPRGLALKMALAAPKALILPKRPRPQNAPAPLRYAPPEFSEAQRAAAEVLREKITLPHRGEARRIRRGEGAEPINIDPNAPLPSSPLRGEGKKFSATLLDGVTGSGKTEVYFDMIAEALKTDGAQALVLLPEIALTAQFLARFVVRFGAAPVLWHSAVTEAARKAAWLAIAKGEARVVVGARSALFLPYKHLRLIVVDEEHDGSYKQEEGAIYHARDMAVARAHHEQLPVVLVSATPSLETLANVRQKKYGEVKLPARHFGAALPDVHLIDMRAEKLPASDFISSALRVALAETLAGGRQAMLFLNRRGYAPLMLCRDCGHRFQCPECTSWLVLHKARAKLACHHCGTSVSVPVLCPACGAEDSLQPCGPGVERVIEEVRALLPQARVAQMTSDTAGDMASVHALVGAMEQGAVDILVGTQMMAKGHHFPKLALVGVVDGDLGLTGGDLRAGERTYQLLHQVSGRAGREDKGGRVMIQTYLPEHPVMQALKGGGRDGFMEVETEMRRQAGLPPFTRLAAIVVEGTNEQEVIAHARRLAAHTPSSPREGKSSLPHRGEARRIRRGEGANIPQECPPPNLPPAGGGGIVVWGPAPAPLARLKGRHRWRLLVKAPRAFPLQEALSAWLAAHPAPRALKIKVDVDPYSFV